MDPISSGTTPGVADSCALAGEDPDAMEFLSADAALAITDHDQVAGCADAHLDPTCRRT